MKRLLMLLCCLLPAACDRAENGKSSSKREPGPRVSSGRPAASPAAARDRRSAVTSHDPEIRRLLAVVDVDFPRLQPIEALLQRCAGHDVNAGLAWLSRRMVMSHSDHCWSYFLDALYKRDREEAFGLLARLPDPDYRWLYLSGLSEVVAVDEIERVWGMLPAPEEKEADARGLKSVKTSLILRQGRSDPEKAWRVMQERMEVPLSASDFLISLYLDPGVPYPVRFLDQIPPDEVGRHLEMTIPRFENVATLAPLAAWLDARPYDPEAGQPYVAMADWYESKGDAPAAAHWRAKRKEWEQHQEK